MFRTSGSRRPSSSSFARQWSRCSQSTLLRALRHIICAGRNRTRRRGRKVKKRTRGATSARRQEQSRGAAGCRKCRCVAPDARASGLRERRRERYLDCHGRVGVRCLLVEVRSQLARALLHCRVGAQVAERDGGEVPPFPCCEHAGPKQRNDKGGGGQAACLGFAILATRKPRRLRLCGGNQAHKTRRVCQSLLFQINNGEGRGQSF